MQFPPAQVFAELNISSTVFEHPISWIIKIQLLVSMYSQIKPPVSHTGLGDIFIVLFSFYYYYSIPAIYYQGNFLYYPYLTWYK